MKKLLIVALIALLMTGGLILMGCASCPNGGCSASTDGSFSVCHQSSCATYQWSQGDRKSSPATALCNC